MNLLIKSFKIIYLRLKLFIASSVEFVQYVETSFLGKGISIPIPPTTSLSCLPLCELYLYFSLLNFYVYFVIFNFVFVFYVLLKLILIIAFTSELNYSFYILIWQQQ